MDYLKHFRKSCKDVVSQFSENVDKEDKEDKEAIFSKIADELLLYHAQCQANENCGILGNDEINLYKARDLARNNKMYKVLKTLFYGLDDDGITAEQYSSHRKSRKLKTVN